MSEQDTREQLEADMQNLNGYPTLCKSLANYVAGLLIAKSDEAYKRGYDDGLHANTKAAFAAAKQAFGVEGDTREQLEVDLNNLCLDCLGLGWNAANDLKKAIRKLLDRQAAVTEREVKLRELYKFEENHRANIDATEEVNRKLNERIAELTAERDELQAAIDAMELGQMYDLYRKACVDRDAFLKLYTSMCEECETVSFAKRIENAVKDGQPVTLFGVDYSPTDSMCDECANMYLHDTKALQTQNKALMREQEKLKKKLHRLRRRLAKAKQQRDYLQKVVKTQAESFKKLERELAGKQ